MMANVAVIGLGVMGQGMATNLLADGHRVTVWNRTPERAAALLDAGAEPARTPALAVSAADVVFEVTADDASSRAVWQGGDGILTGARPGTVLITSATLSVGRIAELASACAQHQLPFYDMPVTGGAAGARTGALTMLVGGDPDGLPALAPVLDSVAREVRHFGPVGAGTRFKLVLNALQAMHMAGFGEAMRLAAAAGLDPEQVGEALVDRPGGVITAMARDNLRTPPEQVNFSAAWARKDLGYAAKMADGLDRPMLDGVLRIFDAAIAGGAGELDWSTVNRPAVSAG
jgi:3-hydroxyisobutyrate dehydrogenase-like beta-hydroxyacid dehydrogenase